MYKSSVEYAGFNLLPGRLEPKSIDGNAQGSRQLRFIRYRHVGRPSRRIQAVAEEVRCGVRVCSTFPQCCACARLRPLWAFGPPGLDCASLLVEIFPRPTLPRSNWYSQHCRHIQDARALHFVHFVLLGSIHIYNLNRLLKLKCCITQFVLSSGVCNTVHQHTNALAPWNTGRPVH